jgi:hypothetical protein
VANHVALVFGFAPLTLIMVNLRPAAFVTLPGAVWLVASPWLLGYASDHAAWLSELVTGMALVVLCATAAGLRSVMRTRGSWRLSEAVIGPSSGRRSARGHRSDREAAARDLPGDHEACDPARKR